MGKVFHPNWRHYQSQFFWLKKSLFPHRKNNFDSVLPKDKNSNTKSWTFDMFRFTMNCCNKKNSLDLITIIPNELNPCADRFLVTSGVNYAPTKKLVSGGCGGELGRTVGEYWATKWALVKAFKWLLSWSVCFTRAITDRFSLLYRVHCNASGSRSSISGGHLQMLRSVNNVSQGDPKLIYNCEIRIKASLQFVF